MDARFLLLALALCAALAGCASRSNEKWPTLAPRPGEMSPLVPRTPMSGACAGCGQDAAAVAVPVAAPAPEPVPADIAGRIAASDKAIAAIEAAFPAQAQRTQAAIKAAAGGGADASSEAEVQRSRLESVFLPLAIEARSLDAIEDDLVGKADAAAARAQVAALRVRVAALEAARDGN
ncbi:MAG: hypothetical protein H7268_08215 [Sandarakinorhabdus sp.]|nr:hypothetical protein [Sandarakinorhabdus sp.]